MSNLPCGQQELCGTICHRTYDEALATDNSSETWKYFCVGSISPWCIVKALSSVSIRNTFTYWSYLLTDKMRMCGSVTFKSTNRVRDTVWAEVSTRVKLRRRVGVGLSFGLSKICRDAGTTPGQQCSTYVTHPGRPAWSSAPLAGWSSNINYNDCTWDFTKKWKNENTKNNVVLYCVFDCICLILACSFCSLSTYFDWFRYIICNVH